MLLIDTSTISFWKMAWPSVYYFIYPEDWFPEKKSRVCIHMFPCFYGCSTYYNQVNVKRPSFLKVSVRARTEFTCLPYGSVWLCTLRTTNLSISMTMFFFIFWKKFGKKWRKTLSWKLTNGSSVKYLWIRKWGRWIWPRTKRYNTVWYVL